LKRLSPIDAVHQVRQLAAIWDEESPSASRATASLEEVKGRQFADHPTVLDPFKGGEGRRHLRLGLERGQRGSCEVWPPFVIARQEGEQLGIRLLRQGPSPGRHQVFAGAERTCGAQIEFEPVRERRCDAPSVVVRGVVGHEHSKVHCLGRQGREASTNPFRLISRGHRHDHGVRLPVPQSDP
jgi:hypothetical protein